MEAGAPPIRTLRQALDLLFQGVKIVETHAAEVAQLALSAAPAAAADPAGVMLKPNPTLAKQYTDEAAKFRRRARGREPQQPAEPEMQAAWKQAHDAWAAEARDLEARASWLEARAPFKASGAPMPPELRTKLEAVDLVDVFRKQLLAPVGFLFAHLAPDDFMAALGALRLPDVVARRESHYAANSPQGRTPGFTGRSLPTPDELAELDASVKAFVAAGTHLLTVLGVIDGRVMPFVVEATAR
jgi:hypothetical protein